MGMEIANLPELKDQLKLYCPNLSGDEKFISTWLGERINKIDEERFKTAINLAVAEICLLNGLETYDEESQREMYIAQMRIIAKFIFEGFGYLTTSEITNAFHLNLQGKYAEVYKQFGKKQINCEFIGQVLTGYREYKQSYINANSDLLKIINPPESVKQIEYKEDIVNDERVMVEREFQKFIVDPEWNFRLLLDCVYLRIEDDELIPKSFYEKFVRKSKIKLLREKQLTKMMPTSIDKTRSRNEDGSIGYILTKNFDMNKVIDSELHQIRNETSYEVKHLAMQFAVAGYFKYCIKRKLKNIYRKEKKKV